MKRAVLVVALVMTQCGPLVVRPAYAIGNGWALTANIVTIASGALAIRESSAKIVRGVKAGKRLAKSAAAKIARKKTS